MSRTVPDAFLAAEHSETMKPIYLYRIQTDNVGGDLFYAEYNTDAQYYKDTSTAQVYTAFPIKRDGITQNSSGRIDSMTLTIGNANKAMSAAMELAVYPNEGLRGYKVTIRKTYAEFLVTGASPNSGAYIEDIFFIDAPVISGWMAITMTLKSRMDVLPVELPARRYSRSTCAWSYKGEGCWLTDGAGWQAPSGFDTDVGGDGDTCGKTLGECERHNNKTRFGGFPSIPNLGRVVIG